MIATIPDDGSVDANTLASYNEVIVTEANNAGVPIWNVYNAMQDATAGIYNAFNGDAFDLSDQALSFGANRRNLSALRMLAAVRNVFFP